MGKIKKFTAMVKTTIYVDGENPKFCHSRCPYFHSDDDETYCTKFDDAVQCFGGIIRSEKCKKFFGQ